MQEMRAAIGAQARRNRRTGISYEQMKENANRRLPAVAATASAPASVSATATSCPLCFGACFVDVQCAASELTAIKSRDGFFSVFGAGHFYKAEAAGAAGFTIRQNAYSVYLPVRFEKLAQLLFRRIEVEIPNKDVLQANCL